MTIAEAIQQLTKGFIKVMGRKPEALEKIKIKQEAGQRIRDLNKVVDMEGEVIDTSKGIMGGKEIKAMGGRAGFDEGGMGLKFFPRASGIQLEKEVGPGIKISERDLNYGITGLLKGDKFFGGAELDKGKVKLDVTTPEGDTLFKDTIAKDDAVNFILGVGDPEGDKFQIKVDDEFENMKLVLKKTFAEGGRAGFKDGPDDPSKRKFMKIMGGLATLPFIGKYFRGVEKAAPVAEKAVEVAGQAPSYFFDLVAKIKTLGRMSDGPSERIKEYSMKGKDGKSEFLLSEDIGTGEMQIKKIGKEGDDMITDVQTMEYTPGSSMADETTKGIPADNYEEFTEYQSRIYKDEFNDPDIVDGINVKEIIEEVKDQAPSIKKASGGIARMLGE